MRAVRGWRATCATHSKSVPSSSKPETSALESGSSTNSETANPRLSSEDMSEYDVSFITTCAREANAACSLMHTDGTLMERTCMHMHPCTQATRTTPPHG